MGKEIHINPQEYKKLYDEGIPNRLLAKKFGCGISTIVLTKRKLGLPKREVIRHYNEKQVDESQFKALYNAGVTL